MTQYSSYEMWHGEYSSIVFLELENWLSALQFPCIFLMGNVTENQGFSQPSNDIQISIRKLGPTRKDSTAFDFAMPLAGKVPFTLSAV